MNVKSFIILFLLCALAFLLRVLSIYWDHGYSLHPDERAIVMIIGNISLPQSISEFLSIQSPLNPHFFAYGSLPIYLLKFFIQLAALNNPDFQNFMYQLMVGRNLSAFVDVGTMVLVFLFGRFLFSKYVGYAAAFIYAISVLPIQTSHFYVVDVLLTFFMMGTLYCGLKFFATHEKKYLIASAVSFGCAISTKISAAPLLLPLGIIFLLLPLHSLNTKKLKTITSLKYWSQLIKNTLTFLLLACITTIICQPYALIDFSSFISDTTAQSEMTRSAFTFPYTLQYVGKIPYLYEIQNVFFWGLGPAISILSLVGSIVFIKLGIKNKDSVLFMSIIFFCAVYFAIVGSFAVGWMRYMLPLYPLLALFAGIALVKTFFPFIGRLPFLSVKIFTSFILFLLVILWPVSFIQIYFSIHPRVAASEWIHQNIDSEKNLGVEHWDDRLPLYGIERYHIIEYPLYEPDTVKKWQLMKENLQETDYIILSSNRLYTPLQKLTDCNKLPLGRCYPTTAQYYHQLFAGDLGFEKVAEFTNYPTIPILNIAIDDQSADESFTVYDHPKVLIFKNINFSPTTIDL